MILSLIDCKIINILIFTITYIKRFSKGIKMKLTSTKYELITCQFRYLHSFLLHFLLSCQIFPYYHNSIYEGVKRLFHFLYLKFSSPPKQMCHLMKNTDIQKYISRSWGIVNIRRSIKILFQVIFWLCAKPTIILI